MFINYLVIHCFLYLLTQITNLFLNIELLLYIIIVHTHTLQAAKEVNPFIFTIATLTGHVIRAYGMEYGVSVVLAQPHNTHTSNPQSPLLPTPLKPYDGVCVN